MIATEISNVRLGSSEGSVWLVSVGVAPVSAKNSKHRFAFRGNVLDLAIGIIIGTAFTAVVQSFVDDIFTPPLGLVLGGVDFVNLTIKMKNFVYTDQPPVVIRYGKFLQTVLSLTIVAFALFFVIKGINQLQTIAKRKKETSNATNVQMVTEEVKVLREIRDLLTPQTSIQK